MTLLHRLRSIFRWIVHRSEAETELDAELKTYVEMAAADNMRDGATPAEARRAAVLELGGVEQAKERVRTGRHGAWLDALGRDGELAFRRLVRAPAGAAAIIATLTIGLGMFAVVSTVVQKILIEPMPYRDPDDLYFVWRDYRAYFDLSRGWLGGPDIAALQEAGGVIEDAAGMVRQFRTFSLRQGAEPAEIAVIVTSPNLFDLLGVAPAMGRGFARSEVGPGRPPLIVLTHDFWNRLGADPAMLGSLVRLNGQPFTVIGVLPPRFAFMRNASLGPPERADAYITFADIPSFAKENPNAGTFAGVMRARRGTSPQAVASAVESVGQAIDARHFNGRGLKLYPVRLKSDLIAPIRPALVAVGFAGVFLLLALIVNLASVLLARAAQREHEFAVSRALGANGAAVVRATLLEGGLLGLVGGAAGALVAAWAIRTLVALAPLDLPRREAVVLDMRIAAAIAGVGVLLGVLAAIAPAAWAARASLSSLLAHSGVRGGGGGHGRMRRGLVIAQIALSLVLLTTGGLVVRSVERLLRADPGFRAEGVLTMRIPVPLGFAHEMKDVIALHDRIERALAAIPGVTGVSATSSLPLMANASQDTITIPGAPGLTGDRDRDSPVVDVIGIRASYVEVMGMRILAGRTFEAARREGVREALIDRHLARQFFPTGSPLGAKIPYGRDAAGRDLFVTIVGVVDHARQYGVHEDGRPQVYVRAEDSSRPYMWVLRGRGDSLSLIPEVRRAVRQTDPRLAVSEVRTMDEVVANSVRQQRVSAVLIASFALGALLLAAMGLFGVISGSVTRRAHEFAVRLALGADHRRVLRMVLGDGARLVAIGLVLGAPAVYFAGRIIRSVLVGVSPFDPLTLSSVAGGLALVAMVACYLPARRVLRLAPARSLRQ